ncbi:MAG: fumarate hydratase [Clostridium sp.]|nr:fumarate hydratase [Clostridium sp.]
MILVDSKTISKAVYTLCKTANCTYPQDLYNLLYKKYLNSEGLKHKKYYYLLKNIEMANEKQRPLCQDTGQVIVFVEIGNNVHIAGNSITKAINAAVETAYKDNFFRKSTVKNAFFDRTNTKTNTPAIIYTEISEKEPDIIRLKLMIKGAGSENYSTIKMFKPTSEKKEIFEFIKNSVITAGEKSCPPLCLGLGIGATMDKAAVLSKKAFFNTYQTDEEKVFCEDLKKFLNSCNQDILDIKIITTATHIACMPVALTINCHSTRHCECVIKENSIEFTHADLKLKSIENTDENQLEINTKDINRIKKLKKGMRILLTGEIYTARDAAHEKMVEYEKEHGKLPFDIKDKIIFYAGPCPPAPNEIIGPVGPTTSVRMDKFSKFIYSKGLVATIGKGERTKETENIILKHNGKYFTAQGGVACLLADCIKKSEVIAFEELGTEAIRKLYIEKFPVSVEI